jgi:geranylgeranyl diphosphate synthase, type II
MHSIDFLKNKIKQAFIELDFIKEPKELYEPIDYTVKIGGKRIRPLLTLLSCDLFNGDIENALCPAIGIELFHNFTLLHDDIMDKAPLRRGKETVYRKWNQDIAILSGDTLFAIAYQNICKTKSEYLKNILEEFNISAIKVCEGQQIDMNFENRNNITISDYIEMIRLKTAALIAASLKIGAIIGEADIKDGENLYKFGENIGIAFQIMDDMLDVYGDIDKFGKKNYGDICTNKKTYLYIKALELAKDENLSKLNYFYKEKETDIEVKVQGVKEIYSALNVRELALKEIDNYYYKAIEYLDLVSVEIEKKAELKNFSKKLMGRDY